MSEDNNHQQRNEMRNGNQEGSKQYSVRFLENPYDLETFMESLKSSADKNKELLFMDRFISRIRLDPDAEVTETSYEILEDLGIIEL